MFEPLQMMITNKLRSSNTASRTRSSTVNQNDDDSSSSPDFDYSSPESDDDNDDNNDNDVALSMGMRKIKGKQGKSITVKDSTKTMATNSIKMGKSPSPGKTVSNDPPSAPETTPIGKNDKTAPQVSIKKVVGTKAIKLPTTLINKDNRETTPVNQQKHEGNVTPTPVRKPTKKKRLTSFEKLDEETQFCGGIIKATTEELLKYKRATHKSLLRDIKEKEDELKRLKESAFKAEKEIEKTLERKKKASKCARDLKCKCAKVIEKAAEEKKRSKAKDAELKVLKKRSLNDIKVEEEEAQNSKAGSAKKKRRLTKVGKKKKRLSDKEDNSDESSSNSDSDDDSDAGDSDWEGASRRKKSSDTLQIDTPSSNRKTRIRCLKWECQKCTLINDGANKECVACEAPKPGTES